MKKLLVYGVIVLLSILIAGLYGVVHNQISYTVSPEYFTKFKFEQFHLLNSPLPERVRASTSYLGGTVAILVAWAFHIMIRLRARAAAIPPVLTAPE